MNDYICHSGGAEGADMAWELVGAEYGVKTIAYSFKGHTQHGKNQKILNEAELIEGFEHVLEANKTTKRNPERTPAYVKKLLSRNWFQVKNSESIYAVGTLLNKSQVSGGTGWAVQMAIDNNKPVYLYEQMQDTWCMFNYDLKTFVGINYVPILTKNFAGIGTRELNDSGLNAIQKVFEVNVSK